MSLNDIPDLIFSAGLYMLALTGVILVAMLYGSDNQDTSLFSKLQRKALIEDYRNKRVALGGPLGLLKIMAILSGGLIVIGGLLKIIV